MTFGPATNWQSQRNRFNHDWLKNKFLLELGKLINIIDERIEDNDFAYSFIVVSLHAWERESSDLFVLIGEFQTKMTPKVLFEQLPLSRLPSQQTWLPLVVDAMWRNRTGTDELVETAQHKTVVANAAYAKLKSLLDDELAKSDQLSAAQLRKYRDEVVLFRSACRELSKAIERFPHRILVT